MSEAPRRPLLKRMANVGMLIGGFGLGQGSIFLAQTWLVATGRTGLLADFGLGFSFAMLGIITVEAGSLTVLARQATSLVRAGKPQQDVWQSYWETTIFRLAMAAIVIAVILAFTLHDGLSGFADHYLLYGAPTFLLWAFNGAGFLDGLQKSGVSGLTGSLAYIASAIGLFFAADRTAEDAGEMLGLALTLGYLATVVLQQAALSALGWRMIWVWPDGAGIRRAFSEELAMLAGLMPGQLYFRVQLLIAQTLLGPSATALLVYAKQVTGAVSQIAGFVRRTEFPAVVHRVESDRTAGFRSLFRLQAISFGFALVAAIGVALAGLVIARLAPGMTAEAWGFLAIFAVTIASEALGQTLMQMLFAHGRFADGGLIRIAAVTIGAALSFALAGPLGILAFVAGDLASHATVSAFSAMRLKKAVS